MNDYAARNASRGYVALHYLELALNLSQWVPGHELPVPRETQKGRVDQGCGNTEVLVPALTILLAIEKDRETFTS